VVVADWQVGRLQGYWLRFVLPLVVEVRLGVAVTQAEAQILGEVDCLPLLVVIQARAQFQAGAVVVWDHLGRQWWDPGSVCCCWQQWQWM
jgi:hypothetical protein